jgi:hypothetical protein
LRFVRCREEQSSPAGEDEEETSYEEEETHRMAPSTSNSTSPPTIIPPPVSIATNFNQKTHLLSISTDESSQLAITLATAEEARGDDVRMPADRQTEDA